MLLFPYGKQGKFRDSAQGLGAMATSRSCVSGPRQLTPLLRGPPSSSPGKAADRITTACEWRHAGWHGSQTPASAGTRAGGVDRISGGPSPTAWAVLTSARPEGSGSWRLRSLKLDMQAQPHELLGPSLLTWRRKAGWLRKLRAAGKEEAEGEASHPAPVSPVPKQEQEDKTGQAGGEAQAGSNNSGPEQRQPTPASLPPPLPEPQVIRLPRSVIDTLRDQVFGFDTFFVTDQEPYEGGVLFQGNLRGDSSLVYTKLKHKLQAKYGDSYALYLLNSPTTGRPVAVVVPRESVEAPPDAVPPWLGAPAFGLVTLLTVLLTNSPSPEFGFLTSVEYLVGPLLQGVPGSLIFLAGLLAHEAGHLLVARSLGLDLALPYFIPSWQIGSFGGITRIKSVVPSRSGLVEVAAAGPLLGLAVSLFFLLTTLAFLRPDPTTLAAATDAAAQGAGAVPPPFYITLDSSAFQDSFLVGALGKVVLGSELVQGAEVAVSPLTLAAWSCLLANAINAIPAGELDGARIALGLFGRQWAQRLFFAALVFLGLAGIFNDVALFWVVLIVFLQRGPIPPTSDEITDASTRAKILGSATLTLAFLVYCPFPFEL